MKPKLKHAIGIVGVGKVARGSHLPAYFWGENIDVVAISDFDEQALKVQADRWNITHRFTDYHRLLEMPEIEVIDVAVPAEYHKNVVLDAISAGKHVLCQKPLADNMDDAVAMVQAAESAGLILAVNQNTRWIPSYRCCHDLIREGIIGTPLLTIFEDHYWTDHHQYELERDHFLLLKNTIHKLDTLRFWFPDEPSGIFASTIHADTHPARGESIASITLTYPNGHVINLIDDGASSSPGFRRILIHGTLGAIRLDDTMIETFKKRPGVRSNWQSIEVTGKRNPDAFYGVMAALLFAIERGEQPEHNARDNLKSLRLAFKTYQSAATQQAIDLSQEG